MDDQYSNAMMQRLHTTALTDQELMLFDALWDGDCALWMLQRDHYSSVTDLPYCHNYSDAQLLKTLASLKQRGFIRSYLYVYAEEDDKRYYGLSHAGGAIWDQERKPSWQRYCYSSEDAQSWFVESPSLETAEHYAKWAHSAGWGAPPHNQLTVIEKPTYRFLPWRDFELVYELRGRVQPKTYRLDWDDYEYHRQWWLDLPELLNR